MAKWARIDTCRPYGYSQAIHLDQEGAQDPHRREGRKTLFPNPSGQQDPYGRRRAHHQKANSEERHDPSSLPQNDRRLPEAVDSLQADYKIGKAHT